MHEDPEEDDEMSYFDGCNECYQKKNAFNTATGLTFTLIPRKTMRGCVAIVMMVMQQDQQQGHQQQAEEGRHHHTYHKCYCAQCAQRHRRAEFANRLLPTISPKIAEMTRHSDKNRSIRIGNCI